MKPDASSDLDWLAFRYLADELEEAERAALESRLADSQAAREALARSVELTQTLLAAERAQPIPLVDPTTSRWRRAAWSAAAVAACLALLLAYQLVRPPDQNHLPPIANGNGIALSDAASSEELAFVWIETVDQLAQFERGDLVDLEIRESDSAVSSGAILPEDDAAFTTPQWMFAAVRGLARAVADYPGVQPMPPSAEN